MDDMLARVTRTVAELGLEEISPLLREALDQGTPPPALLDAMGAGMVRVGEQFEEGEYFLVDLVLAGELMKEGLGVIEPHLTTHSKRHHRGTVVLCTVAGDVHDIGKNLVGTMLTSSGFRVVDLGVDVPAARVLEAVQREGAMAVGLSVLLTPMVASVAQVVTALSDAGLRDSVHIAIGGACTTDSMLEQFGVDAIGRDPLEAVRIFGSWVSADAANAKVSE